MWPTCTCISVVRLCWCEAACILFVWPSHVAVEEKPCKCRTCACVASAERKVDQVVVGLTMCVRARELYKAM